MYKLILELIHLHLTLLFIRDVSIFCDVARKFFRNNLSFLLNLIAKINLFLIGSHYLEYNLYLMKLN